MFPCWRKVKRRLNPSVSAGLGRNLILSALCEVSGLTHWKGPFSSDFRGRNHLVASETMDRRAAAISASAIPGRRVTAPNRKSDRYSGWNSRPGMLPAVRTRASLARISIVIQSGIPAGQICSLPVIRFIPGRISTPARPSMALDHRVVM